jgi:hypothetical protein
MEERFRQMNDAEIKDAAWRIGDFHPTAQTAIRQEISRRGLTGAPWTMDAVWFLTTSMCGVGRGWLGLDDPVGIVVAGRTSRKSKRLWLLFLPVFVVWFFVIGWTLYLVGSVLLAVLGYDYWEPGKPYTWADWTRDVIRDRQARVLLDYVLALVTTGVSLEFLIVRRRMRIVLPEAQVTEIVQDSTQKRLRIEGASEEGKQIVFALEAFERFDDVARRIGARFPRLVKEGEVAGSRTF